MSRVEQLAEGVMLYLGDCREILPSLPKVDAVVTDPPYGMGFQSNRRAEKYDAIINDQEDWPLQFATEFPVTHSRYIFCRWDDISRVAKPKSLVTWVKNNWSMGDLEHEHARQTEVILFYAGPDHFFPLGRPQDVIRAPKTENQYHPTEKPAGLMEAICRWTDGLVVDPFMGSGSTGVGAIRRGRSFIGIEIVPKYFDIACRRISDALKQPDMFIEPLKAKQEKMDL